jgi:hypothetical protein
MNNLVAFLFFCAAIYFLIIRNETDNAALCIGMSATFRVIDLEEKKQDKK